MSSLRLIFQRVASASLRHSSNDSPQTIGKGLVFYVSIGGTATDNFITKSVEKLMKAELWKDPETNRAANLANLDLLILPQASMGGKLKGKRLQYHSNIAKEDASRLYDLFCKEMMDGVLKMNESTDFTPTIVFGEYSALQMLTIDAEIGPNTHFLEFSE